MNHTNRSHRPAGAFAGQDRATMRAAFGPGYQIPVVFDHHVGMKRVPQATMLDAGLEKAFRLISDTRHATPAATESKIACQAA